MLPLCTPWYHIQLHTLGNLPLKNKPPLMNQIRSWMSSKAGWDALEDRKVSNLYQEQNHNSSATHHMAHSQYWIHYPTSCLLLVFFNQETSQKLNILCNYYLLFNYWLHYYLYSLTLIDNVAQHSFKSYTLLISAHHQTYKISTA
jgi:hypothetical protein